MMNECHDIQKTTTKNIFKKNWSIYIFIHSCMRWHVDVDTHASTRNQNKFVAFFLGSMGWLAVSRCHFNFCRILITILVAPRGVFWACRLVTSVAIRLAQKPNIYFKRVYFVVVHRVYSLIELPFWLLSMTFFALQFTPIFFSCYHSDVVWSVVAASMDSHELFIERRQKEYNYLSPSGRGKKNTLATHTLFVTHFVCAYCKSSTRQ